MSMRRAADSGFTLVEVMIALLIFGMIAAAGVAMLSFSIRAQSAMGDRLDDLGAIERLSSIVGADLGQAVDRPTRDERGTLLPAFVGTATTVRLVRGGWINIDAAARASLQKVEYRLDGDTIERIGYPMLDGAEAFPPGPMLDKVSTIALRYRFHGAWSDRWDGTQGAPLPQAVELVITRRDGVVLRQIFLTGTGYAPEPPRGRHAP
ncbi:MAG: type II secretion system minor pseudopilin GspJ [Candidatus Sphingomonas colombiensis]|nr:type II secretion system minor pseudopilin GspJ [Sphingomonas sp.]WEK43440.1 MAG: type II secretion system minor pseudopilin GspJ [Sphingomonas sp.]